MNYASHMSLDNYATDNAMGKVQTVVYAPGGYGAGSLPPIGDLMAAYRAGRSVVTDGPFLEIGLDRDGDGDWYEVGDLRIGDDGTADPNGTLPLRIRWASLPEFGSVSLVRLLGGDGTAVTPLIEFNPALSGQGIDGDTVVDLGAFGLTGPMYLRAELLTDDGDAGHRAFTNPIWITFEETTDVAASGLPGEGLALSVSPNPFHPSAEIRFTLGTASEVRLEVFDVTGRRIRVLRSGPLGAGMHRCTWDGRTDRGEPAASGVYYLRLETETGVRTTKMSLVR